jgi:hypothetical protein
MAWSDIPAILKDITGYFGPSRHEERIHRKFMGYWDVIRPALKVEGIRENKYLAKMDALRKELR